VSSLRRQGVWALAASGLVLTLGWTSGAWRGAPAVYDGLPFNAEPYRYVSPPPGLEGNGAPSSVHMALRTATHAGGTAFALSTSESPPQSSLIASDGDLLPAGQTVTVGIRPVPAPPVTPVGRPDGNVYQVYVEGGSLRPGSTYTVALRGTGAPGIPQLEHLAAGRWRSLPTTHVPPAVYSAPTGSLGDFLLVLPLHGPTPAGGPNGGVVAALVVGGLLLATGAFLWAIRRFRRPVGAGGLRGAGRLCIPPWLHSQGGAAQPALPPALSNSA